MVIKILQGIGTILAGALGCLVYMVLYGAVIAFVIFIVVIVLGILF